MECRTGTVIIKDAGGNVLWELALADDFGFKGNPLTECFFTVKIENGGEKKAAMNKFIDWMFDKTPLILIFGALPPFTGSVIREITCGDLNIDCIRVKASGKWEL